MPIIEDNAEYQVIETVTANGMTRQYVAKPGSRAANQEAIMVKARQALTANATFLAIPTPTAAQVRDHTKILTREMNGVLRLLLNEFADVSDT